MTISIIPTEPNDDNEKWQELMGTDLLLKIFPSTWTTKNNAATLNQEEEEEEEHEPLRNNIQNSTIQLQLHDIVVLDWIGYYCDDSTKERLRIPSSSVSFSCSLKNDENDTNHKDTQQQQQQPQQQILDTLPIFHSAKNFYCCIGDQDVIPALEMGLRFMNITTVTTTITTTEIDIANSNSNRNRNTTNTVTTTIPTKALIYSHSKYAYGISSRTYTYSNNDNTPTATTATTKYTLPSYSNVLYQVTLHQIVDSNHHHDPNVLLSLYHCKKELANDIYQNDILVVPKPTTQASSNHGNMEQGNDHDTDNNMITNTNTTINSKEPSHESSKQQTNTNRHNHSNSNSNNSYHVSRAVRIYQRTVDQLENCIIEWQQELSAQNNDHGDNDDATTNNDTTKTTKQSYIPQARQLQIDCLNNISAVYMKCRMYHLAKEACVRTLLKDPNHPKALFRAAKAALYDPASSYEEVQATIQAVQELVVQSSSLDHPTLQKELELLQKEYQQHTYKYKQQQKVMALRIQQKMAHAKSNSETTKVRPKNNHATPKNIPNSDDNHEQHNASTSSSGTTQQNDENVVRDVSSSTISSSSLSVFSLRSSFSSHTTSSTTKRLFYAILQVLFVLLLLVYAYMYCYIMKDTRTTTISSTPLAQEL